MQSKAQKAGAVVRRTQDGTVRLATKAGQRAGRFCSWLKSQGQDFVQGYKQAQDEDPEDTQG